jgi:hypothetical protein
LNDTDQNTKQLHFQYIKRGVFAFYPVEQLTELMQSNTGIDSKCSTLETYSGADALIFVN